MDDPRDVPIQPLGLAGVLEGAFRLYPRTFPTFAAIIAAVSVPLAVVQFVFLRALLPPDLELLFSGQATTQQAVEIGRSLDDRLGLAIAAGLGIGIAGLFVQAFLSAALLRGALLAYVGERPWVGELFRRGAALTPGVTWVTLLTILVLVVTLVLPAFAIALVGDDLDSDAFFAILVIPLVLLGILLIVRFLFGPNAVIVEGIRGTEALRRSWRLTRGRTWPVLGILLVVLLIGGGVAFLLTLPTQMASPAETGLTRAWLLSMAGGLIAGLVVTPFSMAASALLYVDSRARKEPVSLSTLRSELSTTSA